MNNTTVQSGGIINKNQISNSSKSTHNNFSELSDSQLYQKCKQYGLQTRLWRRKFAGLLPEVAKRELHKKRGYSSIYEFAGKIGGMTHDATAKILRMAAKLEDKPTLKKMLEMGEQGWSKIEKVAWVATPETEAKWAEKVRKMPKQALEVFVQEYRKNENLINNERNTAGEVVINENGHNIGNNSQLWGNLTPGSKNAQHLENIANEGYGEFHEDRWPTLSFAVSPDVEFQLRLLKQTIEKTRGETLTWNEFMEEVVKKCISTKEILKKDGKKGASIAHLNMGLQQKRFQKTSEEKEKGRGENDEGNSNKTDKKKGVNEGDSNKDEKDKPIQDQGEVPKNKTTRNIPTHIKRQVLEKHNGHCAYPNCKRLPTIFHHTKRFALHENHDPKYIVPICAAHENLAHTGEIINEEDNTSKWESGKLSGRKPLEGESEKFSKNENYKKKMIDETVSTYRIEG
ncbi:hypothetical protein HOG48_05310 [Candidatus Peregrinibacteria bacterium]|nr:hypothetical protein [Candidatus Peregrinibacteria bacterium]